jgi:hypothetical protein
MGRYVELDIKGTGCQVGTPKVLGGSDTRSTGPWLRSIFLGWYVLQLQSLKGHSVDICKVSLLLSMAVTKTSAGLTVPKHAWYLAPIPVSHPDLLGSLFQLTVLQGLSHPYH